MRSLICGVIIALQIVTLLFTINIANKRSIVSVESEVVEIKEPDYSKLSEDYEKEKLVLQNMAADETLKF